MGRPLIGERAMTSYERAQRYRNKKRRLANVFNKKAFTQEDWALIEAALGGPTHEKGNKLVIGLTLASQRVDHLSNAKDSTCDVTGFPAEPNA